MLTAVLFETVHETRLKVPPAMLKPPPCTREAKRGGRLNRQQGKGQGISLSYESYPAGGSIVKSIMLYYY